MEGYALGSPLLSGTFQWVFTPVNLASYLPTFGYVSVTAYAPPPGPTTFHYVALGSSLVLGTTGISGTVNSYVHGIFAHLETVHGAGNVTMTILAVDGDDSTDLLSHLTKQTYIDEVKKADLITISIGGNNVMPAARDSSFWSIDEAMAEEGTARFLAEYPQILQRIRDLNSDVTFFYPRYSVFTWWFVQYTRDPHLNQRGQDLMRDIHINVINTSQSYLTPIRQYSLTATA
jgi:hypothetical protein